MTILTIKSIASRVRPVRALAVFSSLLLPLAVAAAGAQAPVKVEAAWVRATVPGQQATGGFMKLTAREALQLVGVSSPLAAVAEVHEMKVEGDVMKMRAVPVLDLPAGKTVELKPGGYHLMLMDLKQALPKDSVFPLTLLFRNAKGGESKLVLKLPVSARSPEPTDAHKH